MSRLTGPLRYLRVWHPTKLFIDLILPAVFATLIFVLRFFFYPSTGLLGPSGLFSLLVPLLGALSGFYIAALTAVSAFPIASLDNEMPGDRISILGEANKKNPSRRQFLSLQFGYLAFISISTFIFSLFSIYFTSIFEYIKFIEISGVPIGLLFSWIGLLFSLFLIFNIISVTFFSLYYLSDRIHQFEPTLTGGPGEIESHAER